MSLDLEKLLLEVAIPETTKVFPEAPMSRVDLDRLPEGHEPGAGVACSDPCPECGGHCMDAQDYYFAGMCNHCAWKQWNGY